MIRFIEENSIADITHAISDELGLDYKLLGSQMAEITMPDRSITTLQDKNGDIVWMPEYGHGYSRLHFGDYDSLSDFIDDIEWEIRGSKLEAANIKAKNEGILEVPEGKKVYDLPVSHFKNLIDRKGREAIIRAITNLQVWNKNDDPKISKWAKDMKKSLEGYGEKKESASLSEASVYDGFAKQYGQKIKNQNISSMKTSGSEILINYKNGIQMILDMDNPDQSQLDISRLNLPEKGSLDDVLEGMAAITQFQELISDNYQSFLDSLEEMSE